ncbi:hypothetical protein K9P40_07985 [Lentilactobacillus otakiensis]|nr:hypothetical protein [Lentilactobacillus otakiensis]
MTTELEKCQNCELYDAHDPYFKKQKAIANQFLQEYNRTGYADSAERFQLLQDHLGSIGGGSVVRKDIPAGVVAVGNPCHVLRKVGQK